MRSVRALIGDDNDVGELLARDDCFRIGGLGDAQVSAGFEDGDDYSGAVVVWIRILRVAAGDGGIDQCAAGVSADSAADQDCSRDTSNKEPQIDIAGPGKEGRAIIQTVFWRRELRGDGIGQRDVISAVRALIGDGDGEGLQLTWTDWIGRSGLDDPDVRDCADQCLRAHRRIVEAGGEGGGNTSTYGGVAGDLKAEHTAVAIIDSEERTGSIDHRSAPGIAHRAQDRGSGGQSSDHSRGWIDPHHAGGVVHAHHTVEEAIIWIIGPVADIERGAQCCAKTRCLLSKAVGRIDELHKGR